MSYTKFGEQLRILRIKNHEVMGDLAKALGVSVAFLSSVETGKKNVPERWCDDIAEHYTLSAIETAELKKAAAVSKPQMKIDLRKVFGYKREMAMQFARSFEDIDDETAKKIISLLEGKDRC